MTPRQGQTNGDHHGARCPVFGLEALAASRHCYFVANSNVLDPENLMASLMDSGREIAVLRKMCGERLELIRKLVTDAENLRGDLARARQVNGVLSIALRRAAGILRKLEAADPTIERIVAALGRR